LQGVSGSGARRGTSRGVSPEDLRRQVRSLKEAKGFDVTPERRPAYLMAEVGEVADEVLKLSRNGDAGETSAAKAFAAKERLGMEIYDAVWNPLDLAELAGVEDLEGIFAKKARLNEEREW
jgi:NTP pyrophosphatase (non-canonical NTP hydrolase)